MIIVANIAKRTNILVDIIANFISQQINQIIILQNYCMSQQKCKQNEEVIKYSKGSFYLMFAALVNLVLNLGVLIFVIIQKYIGFNGFNVPSSSICSSYVRLKWANFYNQIVSLCFLAILLSFVLSALTFIIVICWYIKSKNKQGATDLIFIQQKYEISHQKKVWIIFIINSLQVLCKILFLNYANIFLEQNNCKGSLNIILLIFISINGVSILFGISIMLLIVWLRNLFLQKPFQQPPLLQAFQTFGASPSHMIQLQNENQSQQNQNIKNIQSILFATNNSQKKVNLLEKKQVNQQSIAIKKKNKKKRKKKIKQQQNKTQIFQNVKSFFLSSLQTLGNLTVKNKEQEQNQIKNLIINEKVATQSLKVKDQVMKVKQQKSQNNKSSNKNKQKPLSQQKIKKLSKIDQIKQLKKQRVIGKLNQIQKQKKMCHQIYQESINSQNSDQFDNEGEKITKYVNAQKKSLKIEKQKVYSHPHQYLNQLQQAQCGSNSYSNWKLYKQEIAKKKFNVIEVQEKTYYQNQQYMKYQIQKDKEKNKVYQISDQMDISSQQQNTNEFKKYNNIDSFQKQQQVEKTNELESIEYEQNVKENINKKNIKQNYLQKNERNNIQNINEKQKNGNINKNEQKVSQNTQTLNLQQMFNEEKLQKIIQQQQQETKIHPQNIVESHQMYLTQQILNFHLIQKQHLQKKNKGQFFQNNDIDKFEYPIKRKYQKPQRTQKTFYSSYFKT